MPDCGHPVEKWSVQEILKDILKKFDQKQIIITAPLIQAKKGSYEELFNRLIKDGFLKVYVNGKIYPLQETPRLERYKKHTIDLVIDEIFVESAEKERITESLELAMKYSKGLVKALFENKESFYSLENACPHCAIGFEKMEPRLFSFNAPQGACPDCNGLGIKIEIAEDLVVPDKTLSINEGALAPWQTPITSKTHRWQNSWAKIGRASCRERV